MKFQPGDIVRYISDEDSSCLKYRKIYKVSRRHEFDAGVCIEGFSGPHDWWFDHRFELVEPKQFYILTTCELQKFTKEELLAELERLNKSTYNPYYEAYRCAPVKVKVRSIIEIEE